MHFEEIREQGLGMKEMDQKIAQKLGAPSERD